MGKITLDQSHAIMAALATNTDWSTIDFDGAGLQDRVMRDMAGAGQQFTTFLRNGARVIVGEPRIIPIDRSKPFNPAEFIGAGWTIWRGPADGDGLSGDEEQDLRSLALAQIDLSAIVLKSTLKPGETAVGGEEKLKRLKVSGEIRLDAGAFKALWDNRELLPARFKEKTNGNTTYIYCDGTVLRSPRGFRCVLCFYFFDGAWSWRCRWLGDDWGVGRPSAVLASNQA
ncbi:MAG: hypothetical protein A2735_02990 [Candidatus Yanofskybacteria bacterium RIFCSPHIGHO2_01_FULL_41_21]|uniref:Uncharacterized protein n=1 Tax=Candidatus Yanofskybacteria bacterium RIFCSPHIGHO2_01_FULL_41_21 TaxID=1802660 RepID=A0A1F8EAF3_9BACT|nr:MAG: hypothetical protein A2735_02990 [Candidatus Yanofskybacteria bacterium RIFCSPHIGHO2_01_FULL_41_21]